MTLTPVPVRSTLLTAVLLLGLAPLHRPQSITKIIDASGVGTQPLDGATSIALDSQGNRYVTGSFSHNVFKITPSGVITQIIGSSSGLNTPIKIAVDAADNLFVCDLSSSNLYKRTPGGVISVIPVFGVPYLAPADLAFDGAGNLYIPCLATNNVVKMTPAGVFSNFFSSPSLQDPVRVAVDGANNIYVAGGLSDNVYKITPSGVGTQIIGPLGDYMGNILDGTSGIAIDSMGNAFVTGSVSDNVFMITDPGGLNVITLIMSALGDGINPLTYANKVAVNSADDIYVSGKQSQNVFLITDPGGANIIEEIIEETGDGASDLDGPTGLLVDPMDNVYITGHHSDNCFFIPANLCGQPLPATYFAYNGSGINLDTLASSSVRVGRDWVVTLQPQAARGPGAWVLFLRSANTAGPVLDLGTLLGLPSSGGSELLVNPGAFLANFSPPGHAGGGTTATFATHVPPNCSLLGSSWFAQALVLGNLPTGAGTLDPHFSSAVGGMIGTP